jgi:hypothetical protein
VIETAEIYRHHQRDEIILTITETTAREGTGSDVAYASVVVAHFSNVQYTQLNKDAQHNSANFDRSSRYLAR